MQKTNSSISPSSTLSPKIKGSWHSWRLQGNFQDQRCFPWAIGRVNVLASGFAWKPKNIRFQSSPDSSAICLFPPGSYKSGRTDFLRACIEGWMFHSGNHVITRKMQGTFSLFLSHLNIFNTNKLQTHRFYHGHPGFSWCNKYPKGNTLDCLTYTYKASQCLFVKGNNLT